MKPLLKFKAGNKTVFGQKFIISLLLLSVLIFTPLQNVSAQLLTSDPVAATQRTAAAVKDTFWKRTAKLIQKAGSLAFQRVLSSALNKIAYDAADYVGSGGKGQKPLFITKGLGAYLEQIGDEAAGQFIESFVNNLNTPVDNTCSAELKSCRENCQFLVGDSQNDGQGGNNTSIMDCYAICDQSATGCASQNPSTVDEVTPSFNVCNASSIEAKVKIGLGLVDQTRPSAPNCSASQMIENWGDDINKKIKDLQDGNYLNEFVNIFDPRANDVGIFVTAQTDLSDKVYKKNLAGRDNFITNKGFLDVRNIAGTMEGVPQSAQNAADDARKARQEALGKTTGDIFVDAANVFLNQLYISAFNNLLQSLGKTTEDANKSGIASFESDPSSSGGQTALNDVTNTLLQAKFEVRTDYDILSELSVCTDPENPGPTNCVIDSLLLQGIAEKKTVAEAIKQGYLHRDWQLTTENRANTYSLRNISIMRKYRILPVGWEEAVNRIVTRTNNDPTNPKKYTLSDFVSCFDPSDEYNDFSIGFNTNDQGWCQGLIDPNWVLKAPSNYCKKEGFSSQIMSRQISEGITGTGGTPDTLSKLSITHPDDYCADNQTCIKEKSDGSCEAYGYCNEDRRTWAFGSDSCSAINNTCQAFINSDSGASVAYLENTLDYDSCTSENSGCRQYALSGTYAAATDSVSWNGASSVFLNKNAKLCDGSDNGCTELMRLRPTWGSNLVMNTDFGGDTIGNTAAAPRLNSWPLQGAQGTIVDATLEPGGSTGKVLRLNSNTSNGGVYSDRANSLLPDNFQTIPGQSYTLSADIYLSSGSSVNLSLGVPGEGFSKVVTALNSWQHVTVTRIADSAYNDPDFYITGNNAVFYVKNIKFEISSWDTGYGSYGRFKVYEKLLPPYLEQSCYVDAVSATKDYSLKANAPQTCNNFARKCNKEEAGCELYSSPFGNFSVPAKVVSSDYCSDQCLGYDIYIAKASHFNPAVAENLIPARAKACSAAAAGCNEFTNLDQIAAGGEGREYYSALKQCVKPAEATCSTFYAWEGTAAGYQLKSFSLKSLSNLPEVASDDSALCSAAIYNLPITDANYNADCREFYNTAGVPSYHLVSRTITCSENCHAYRLSDTNIVKNMSAAQCSGADKHWNAGDSTCNVCLNGGVWDLNNNGCLYQAIPGEGQSCSASENGCREYNGNSGNNVRLITSYDFEGSVPSFWTSNCVGGLTLSTIANSKDGHSLQYSDAAGSCQAVGLDAGGSVARTRLIDRILANPNVAAQLAVGNSVTQGNAYTAKFVARATTDTSVQMYFMNRETGAKSYFNGSNSISIKGGDEWNVYQISLDNLDHPVSPNERLIISSVSGSFLFDDFMLSEITDRYYLVKNSSQIPNVCYYDIFDEYQGADYNLGCSQYTDRGGLAHNLRQFSKLCQSSAVGCEQMIDSKNYGPATAGIWNDTNLNGSCDPVETDCAKVSGDATIYAIYDTKKLCSSVSKGCSRLGQGQGGTIINSWVSTYKINNPDSYGQTLCLKDNVGCEAWKSKDDGSMSYYKNPGSNTCTYRASTNPTISGKAWYKIASMRCDANDDAKISGSEVGTPICTGDTDCNGHKCVIDNNDYVCAVTPDKTIGLGGSGNQVWVPDASAGLCEATQSGCTEYIDPVSQFASNLVLNSNYQTINGSMDGWGVADPNYSWTPSATQQVIRLERNKLYSLSISYTGAGAGDVSLTFVTDVKALQNDNKLGAPVKTIAINDVPNRPTNIIFNSLDNTSALLSGGTNNKSIEVKELVIDYQLEKNIDKKSCNGLQKFDNGCILFNERSIAGNSGFRSLTTGWDAYKTLDGATPTNCVPGVFGSCTANILIKVRPNRVCSKWLDCITYVEDPQTKQQTCYAVGECDRLDDKNECANYTSSGSGTKNFDAKYDKNATGYALVNKYYFNNIKEVGFNTTAHYDFEDTIPPLSCRRDVGNIATSSNPCVFDKNIFTDLLVREPDKSPTDYPAHGRTYLRVPSTFQVAPLGSKNYIVLETPAPGQSYAYYLSYMVNTKNSGLGAKVIITDENNFIMNDVRSGRPLIATTTANAGWETRIFKFNAGQADDKIKIFLAADSKDVNSGGSVYFDNINIEPVLEIGPNQYAVRECRLYPTEDSLTCVNKDENVISDGLEGYCMEHDAFNPNVCILWYPVDKISTAKATQSSLGYNGAFPLNYCTEANGNFNIVEKRVGAFVKHHQSGDLQNTCVREDSNSALCSHCPGGTCDNYYIIGTGGDKQMRRVGCFPKPELLLPGTTVTHSYNSVGITCTGTYEDGWGVADGFSSGPSCNVDSSRIERCQYFDDSGVLVTGIENGAKVTDEALNANPPLRVYDYSAPPATPDDLKYAFGNDTDKQFRLECNKFVEVVDGAGDNKAWVSRISKNSVYSTTTPGFFVNSSNAKYSGSPWNLNRYGRNNETVPFGAATWPDSFNLLNSGDRVTLRSQYSKKNNENIFAGRPYGCGGVSSKGCKSIGSCSLDSSVYCLTVTGTDTDLVGKQTCAGLGYCIPLWFSGLAQDSFKDMLKTIFIKSFNSYSFNGGVYVSSSEQYNDASGGIPCPGGVRSGEGTSSFCSVPPTISNIKLYSGNTKIALTAQSGSSYIIPSKGVYRLEFNSQVDVEQQPLKKIVINWGDGNQQIISGEDQHPTNPHAFYHFYSTASSTPAQLKVTVYDNWDVSRSN